MLYAEQRPTYQVFHYDFATGQRMPVPIHHTYIRYINEYLVFSAKGGALDTRSVALFDLRHGVQHSVTYTWTATLPKASLALWNDIRSSKEVYVLRDNYPYANITIVALTPQGLSSPQVVSITSDVDYLDVLQYLRQHGIKYEIVQQPYRRSIRNLSVLVTPKGGKWADDQGIFLHSSELSLALTGAYGQAADPRFIPATWALNESVVVYRSEPTYVIDFNSGVLVLPSMQWYKVDQPLLLLHTPGAAIARP
jgi:hypothetical protein